MKQLLQQHPIEQLLRSFAIYTWMSVGVLLALYMYFIGAITFSIITQKQLTQDNKALVSAVGKQELQYLAKDKMLTRDYALAMGLVSAEQVAYVTSHYAVALR